MVEESALSNRVGDFLQAPLAALMFAMADRADLGAENLADPATASLLASYALSELEPWRGDGFAARGRAEALEAVRSVRVRQLATSVLADPRNSWWDAPLDRKSQLLLRGQDERPVDPWHIPVPVGPISRWETYAQKPEHAMVMTTTELEVGPAEQVRSGGHANLACARGGDWQPVYPVTQVRLQVALDARVFEVHSAADWHTLTTRYGDPATHQGSDANLQEAGGIDNGPAPHMERGSRGLRRCAPQLRRSAHRRSSNHDQRPDRHHNTVGVGLGMHALGPLRLHFIQDPSPTG